MGVKEGSAMDIYIYSDGNQKRVKTWGMNRSKDDFLVYFVWLAFFIKSGWNR